AFRSANSGSTHHDRDRLTRGAATWLSFAAGRSTAPLPLAQRSSGRLSRAPPPRKISSHDRQRIPHRYALSFEIVFDGHCDHSPTDAGDSQIPIARAADRRPSDSRFPSLKVFERRPRLGPTASLCEGPASENLHRSGHSLIRSRTAGIDPSLRA